MNNIFKKKKEKKERYTLLRSENYKRKGIKKIQENDKDLHLKPF